MRAGLATPLLGGVLCVGGSTKRLEIVQTTGAGNASSTVSVVTEGALAPGQTRTYQFWFRDTSASCGAGSNLSGAYRVDWN